MNFMTYTHQEGDKHLPSDARKSVVEALTAAALPRRSLKAAVVRKRIFDLLHSDGWSGRTKLDKSSGISVASVRGSTALCLQTGNMSRFYADLLKLQLLYLRQKITAAIVILPTHTLAKRLGSNVASYERLIRELDLFRDIISVPLIVYGLQEG